MKQQPFASPEEALEHYGIKGMRWGVRKEDLSTGGSSGKKFAPGSPEFQKTIERLSRTDHPQVLMPGNLPRGPKTSGKSQTDQKAESTPQGHTGLTRDQKIFLAVGAVTVAAAGYYAYQHYSGGKMPGLDLNKIAQEEQKLAGMNLPKSWDVRGLKDHPLSTQALGNLAAGHVNAELIGKEDLVINTVRGYADILPKNGFDNPFAAEQHASVTRVLEEMRDKYPAIRNLNVEVIPMSRVPGIEGSSAHMCVLPMRAGEARVMYNDLIDKPSEALIRANRKFLPGLGAKDYVARHEMGHLLAVAHGELPPAWHMITGDAGPSAARMRAQADPLLHKRMFAKHGFSFKELSRLSKYAATEPAEAMAELVGHTLTPEMRGYLTQDQFERATAMINEMGGLT